MWHFRLWRLRLINLPRVQQHHLDSQKQWQRSIPVPTGQCQRPLDLQRSRLILCLLPWQGLPVMWHHSITFLRMKPIQSWSLFFLEKRKHWKIWALLWPRVPLMRMHWPMDSEKPHQPCQKQRKLPCGISLCRKNYLPQMVILQGHLTAGRIR